MDQIEEINWADIASQCQSLVTQVRGHVKAGMRRGEFRRERFTLKCLCKLGIIRRKGSSPTDLSTAPLDAPKLGAMANHVLKWCPFEIAAALLFIAGEEINAYPTNTPNGIHTATDATSCFDMDKIVDALELLEDQPGEQASPASRSQQYVSLPERRLCGQLFNHLFLWKPSDSLTSSFAYLPMLPTYVSIGALYPLLIGGKDLAPPSSQQHLGVKAEEDTATDDTDVYDEDKSQNTIADSLLANSDFAFLKVFVSSNLTNLVSNRADGVLALIRVLLFDDRVHSSFTLDAIQHVTRLVISKDCAGKSEEHFRHICSQLSTLLKTYYKGKEDDEEMNSHERGNSKNVKATQSFIPRLVQEAASRSQKKSVFGTSSSSKELSDETLEERLHMAIVSILEGLTSLKGISPTIVPPTSSSPPQTSKPLNGLVLLNKCFLGPLFAPLALRRAAEGQSVEGALRALWGIVHGSSLKMTNSTTFNNRLHDNESISSLSPNRRIICLIWDAVAHGVVTAYCEIKHQMVLAQQSSEAANQMQSRGEPMAKSMTQKRIKLIEEIPSDTIQSPSDQQATMTNVSKSFIRKLSNLADLIENILDVLLINNHLSALSPAAEELLLVFVEAAHPQSRDCVVQWLIQTHYDSSQEGILSAVAAKAEGNTRMVSSSVTDPHLFAEYLTDFLLGGGRGDNKNKGHYFVHKLFVALVESMSAQRMLRDRMIDGKTTKNLLSSSPQAALALCLLSAFDAAILMGLGGGNKKTEDPAERSVLSMISFLSLLVTMDDYQTLLLVGIALPQLIIATENVLTATASQVLELQSLSMVAEDGDEVEEEKHVGTQRLDKLQSSADIINKIMGEVEILRVRFENASRPPSAIDSEIVAISEGATTSLEAFQNRLNDLVMRYQSEITLLLDSQQGQNKDEELPDRTESPSLPISDLTFSEAFFTDLNPLFNEISRAAAEATNALMARTVAAQAVAMRRLLARVKDLADGIKIPDDRKSIQSGEKSTNSSRTFRSIDTLIEQGLKQEEKPSGYFSNSQLHDQATRFAKILKEVGTLCFRVLISPHNNASSESSCATDLFVQSNAIQILAVLALQRMDGGKGSWVASTIKAGLLLGILSPSAEASSTAKSGNANHNNNISLLPKSASNNNINDAHFIVPVPNDKRTDLALLMLEVLSAIADADESGATIKFLDSAVPFGISDNVQLFNILCDLVVTNSGTTKCTKGKHVDRRLAVAALQLLGRVFTLLRPRVELSTLLMFCTDVFRSTESTMMARAAASASVAYVTIWTSLVENQNAESGDPKDEIAEEITLLGTFAKNLSSYTPLVPHSANNNSQSSPQTEHDDPDIQHIEVIRSHGALIRETLAHYATNLESRAATGNATNSIAGLQQDIDKLSRMAITEGDRTTSTVALRAVAQRLLSAQKVHNRADFSQFTSLSRELSQLRTQKTPQSKV